MIEVYAKRQRSKRKDPQQESIVTEKDKLNERTTKLISLMKAMKSGWNGGPSPDIGVEKFNLTQPIPDVVVGSGDAALHELSEIVQNLRQIKTMQDTYSDARQKRVEQLKQIQQVPAAPEQPNTIAGNKFYIIKVASNPFSRIWTHIIAYNPFVNERDRSVRLALLRSLGRIDDNLQELEDNILSSSESSVLDSVYIAKQLYSDAKPSFFSTFRKNIDQMLSDTNKELEDLKNKINSDISKGEKNSLNTEKNKVILEGIKQLQETISEKEEKQEVATVEKNPLVNTEVKFPSKEDLKENIKLEEKPSDENLKQEETTVTNKKQNIVSRPIRRNKRKIPIAPVVKSTSDFIDSDFEAQQKQEQIKYLEVAKYLYSTIDNFVKESYSIASSNLNQPWKNAAIQEYKKILELGTSIISKIKNGEDYELDYVAFLISVGLIKSIDYVVSVENDAIKQDQSLVTGFMFNESELKTQADNFSKIEFAKYYDLANAKIAQASTTVSRFIKRMITHLIPKKDRSLRLTISRNIREARKGLESMLNLLEERHLNFRRLISVSDMFFESLKNCYENLADLADMYNSTMRIEKSYRKQNKERMSYDMIPTLDINALRIIFRNIDNDNSNVQKLSDLENSILETSEILEKDNVQ